MKWVKIRIPDPEKSARAMVEMARRGRIDCYADDTYVVPEPALQFLEENSIAFQELERGGRDWAEKMLQDTLAAHEQRRKPFQRRSVPVDVP